MTFGTAASCAGKTLRPAPLHFQEERPPQRRRTFRKTKKPKLQDCAARDQSGGKASGGLIEGMAKKKASVKTERSHAPTT